jgi:hypothetical protein
MRLTAIESMSRVRPLKNMLIATSVPITHVELVGQPRRAKDDIAAVLCGLPCVAICCSPLSRMAHDLGAFLAVEGQLWFQFPGCD